MRVEGFINMDNIYMNMDYGLLKEGDIIEGRILEILEDLAIIELKDFGVMKARLQGDFTEYESKSLTFAVKTLLPNKIELSPIINENKQEPLDLVTKKEDYLINILREYHIEEDPINLEYLDSLLKYNVSINKDNLENGLKALDKLEQLMNINEKEVVMLANPHEEFASIGKEDIRNLIIQSKDESNKQIDLMPMLEENFNQLLERDIDSNIIKVISIFTKYDIKPTMNNIKFFLQLTEDPYAFSENFKVLETILEEKFTKFNKKDIIKSGGSKNIIEQNIIKHKDTLEKLIELYKDDDIRGNKNVLNKIGELQNKLEFFHELRDQLNMVYLPLIIGETRREGIVTLIKDRRKRENPLNTINIFINLQTNRLGDIKISCKVNNDIMDILFNNINEEDMALFKNKENILKDMVSATGYSVNSIRYSTRDEESILDHLIINTKPIYFLDVQV